MPRWEPDARRRLVRAALELFDERGYDATTVAAVTARAGLSRSTFFRHFTDKREVLSGEQARLVALVASGIEDAAVPDGPERAVALVRAGLGRLATGFDEAERDLAPIRHRIVAATPELSERTVAKRAELSETVGRALERRGVPVLEARVLGSLAVLAFVRAHEGWADPAEPRPFAVLLPGALDAVLEATASALGGPPTESGGTPDEPLRPGSGCPARPY